MTFSVSRMTAQTLAHWPMATHTHTGRRSPRYRRPLHSVVVVVRVSDWQQHRGADGSANGLELCSIVNRRSWRHLASSVRQQSTIREVRPPNNASYRSRRRASVRPLAQYESPLSNYRSIYTCHAARLRWQANVHLRRRPSLATPRSASARANPSRQLGARHPAYTLAPTPTHRLVRAALSDEAAN